ncbi:Pkinase domain-containing protein/Lectin_legB domain-containing protein [Cephalotus follicularis]|uniref:non-specific serine/threonine protein kinase n=1 Tax=Cephalotus follicularis TaxID=3775 RepID=A0A1Q3CDZ5_CEPFO|nr:Pkinase domain-containing protein/Lectin_legB domain-containing protein [Cephalotus follicularis]
MAETNNSLYYFMIIFWVSNSSSTMAQDETGQFIYNGFLGTNVRLDGTANIHPNGLLQLTNTSQQQMGHAFCQSPFTFNSSSSTPAQSMSVSTTFIFAMVPKVTNNVSGHGIVFIIAPSMDFSQAFATQYLGLFNSSNNGLAANHVLAIELDTIRSPEFEDIDDNHVGIDVNSLESIKSAPASYFSNEERRNISLELISGDPIQVWIDYDAAEMLLNVTLAPIGIPTPNFPLLSTHINLSDIFLDTMYVGFSAATGAVASDHYILGWSFNRSGKAQSLEVSKLPTLPDRQEAREEPGKSIIIIALPVAASMLLIIIMGATYLFRRKKYEEVREEWEREYGPQRFSYKNLYNATKGFSHRELLGAGGFGQVYRGTLPPSNQQIAVKRISHNSKQGMKEFVAEIFSMRRLRHKNLVQLLGYCRRKGQLFLVYDYMPNGSLDRFLFRNNTPTLDWPQRFKILRGIASALLYLHEEWEQVVLHRDIKASNILLDANLDGRLGDFGLAKLYDRDSNPQTTQLVGTPGYLAPEITRTGKATVGTDVFAFGVFMLEVACGKRPIEHQGLPEERNLVDWVTECCNRGAVLDVCDLRLEGAYVVEEMELVLKLGVLCSHSIPAARPSMRQVVQCLNGDTNLPDILPESAGIGTLANQTLGSPVSFDSDYLNSFCSLTDSNVATGR